jgi:hypothetical protein
MANTASPIQTAAELIDGTPYGAVEGPGFAPHQPLPHLDARERALDTFAEFVSRLVFQRTGDVGKGGRTIAFRVRRDDIHVYQPDSPLEGPPPAPGIGMLPGRAVHEPYGLGPPQVLEDTVDAYGLGTVLERQGDHVETFAVEVVASKQAERVAVVAGLKSAFRIGDSSGALRLVCRGYYDRVASFRLDESEQVDDQDAARNRRRGHLYVQLHVQEVQLVRYRLIVPRVAVEVARR